MNKRFIKQFFCGFIAIIMLICNTAPVFAYGGDVHTGRLIYEGTGIRHSVVPEDEGITPDTAADESKREFPEKFNSADMGLINSPEAQAFGDCWAYSAISVLEANAAKKGMGERHFSKSHLCWFTLTPQKEGMKADDPWNYGGNHMLAAFTLSNLEGIANQSDYPNKTADNTLTFTNADRFNRDSGLIIDEAVTLYNADDVKQWITENGAAVISYYEDGSFSENENIGSYMIYNGYLDNYRHPSNHAITVIGWDDTIPASAFSVCGKTPAHPGAWIVKNSWYGDERDIMYMSYDQPASDFGGLKVRADDVFRNYTHAERGSSGYLFDYYAEQADVFKSKGDETISRVGFVVDAFGRSNKINVKIGIYKNLPSDYTSPLDGTLAGTYSAVCPCDGLFTVELDNPVGVSKGEIYAVTVSFEDEGGKSVAVQVEQDFENTKYVSGNGESYFRLKKTDDFIDLNKDFSRLSKTKGIHNTFVQVYTKCNHTVKESDGKRICDQCGKDLSEICEKHTGGYWRVTKKATANEDGVKAYCCSECATVIKTQALPALGRAKVVIVNNPGTKKADYSDILRLKAETETFPEEGYRLEWFVNGEKAGAGSEISLLCERDMSVSVKIVDEKGNTLKDLSGNETQDSETVKVDRGLFKLIIGFFRSLFGRNKTIQQ